MFKLQPFSDPDSVWAQRFDRNGQACWLPDGRVVIANSTDMWNESYLLREGVVMIRDQIEVGPNEYVHRAYAIDTTGEHVWSPQGIELVCGGGESIRIFVDGVGGFFHSFRGSDGVFRTCHYDGNANLIAAGADGNYLYIPDSSGGGIDVVLYHDTFPSDTAYLSHQRFNSDLETMWPAPTIIIDLATAIWAFEFVPDERGGVLGLISANEGIALYHVDANGTLGGYLSAQERANPIGTDIGLMAYPNPFNSSTRITLSLPPHIHRAELRVHNLLGQEVLSQQIGAESGRAEFVLDGAGLATGVYLVSARAGENIVTQKVMLLK